MVMYCCYLLQAQSEADVEAQCSHSTEDAKLYECIDRQRGNFLKPFSHLTACYFLKLIAFLGQNIFECLAFFS
jgi:hypothetical protein